MGLIQSDVLGMRNPEGAVFEARDSRPRIGGSFGGFIALVVCLVFIIIVTCTATFFLLRDHEPTDAERAARRRRYHHQPSSGSTSPPKKWLCTLKGMFSSMKSGSRSGRGGWIQANSGDEWDDSVDSDVRRNRNRSGPSNNNREMSYSPALDTPFRPPPIATADSTPTVRFEVISASRQTEPFQSLYSNYPSVKPPGMSSPGSSPVHDGPSPPLPVELPRSMSPEPIPGTTTSPSTSPRYDRLGGSRKGSSQSTTMTFTGGTKFIESL